MGTYCCENCGRPHPSAEQMRTFLIFFFIAGGWMCVTFSNTYTVEHGSKREDRNE
jgi:hypothetical protein